MWKIKRFTGADRGDRGGPGGEQSLVASVELIATTREKKAWSRPPISMAFQVCAGVLLAWVGTAAPWVSQGVFIVGVEVSLLCIGGAVDPCAHRKWMRNVSAHAESVCADHMFA